MGDDVCASKAQKLKFLAEEKVAIAKHDGLQQEVESNFYVPIPTIIYVPQKFLFPKLHVRLFLTKKNIAIIETKMSFAVKDNHFNEKVIFL